MQQVLIIDQKLCFSWMLHNKLVRQMFFYTHHWFLSVVMHWIYNWELYHFSGFQTYPVYPATFWNSLVRMKQVLKFLSTCLLMYNFEKGLRKFPYPLIVMGLFRIQRWNFADIIEIRGTHFGRNQNCVCFYN